MVRSETISRYFVLESLKNDDTFILRLVYPPEINPITFRSLVLSFGNTIGEVIPEQFKVRIVPIELTPKYKIIQAEIDNFAWHPYSFELIEKSFVKLKSALSGIKL